MPECQCSYCIDYNDYLKCPAKHSQSLLNSVKSLLQNINIDCDIKSFKVVDRNTIVNNIKLDGERFLGIYDGKDIIICPYAEDNGIHVRALLHEYLHSIFPLNLDNSTLDNILRLIYEGAIDALSLFALCKDNEGKKEFEYFVERFESSGESVIYINIAKIWATTEIQTIIDKLKNFNNFRNEVEKEFNSNKMTYECYPGTEDCYYSSVAILAKILNTDESIISLSARLFFCK